MYGGKIYAVGGQHGHDEGLVTTPYLDVYDSATNTWTELPDMPVAKSHISAATFVLQGRILAVAGETANGVWTAEIAAYDPVMNAWEELTPFPKRSTRDRASNARRHPLHDGRVLATNLARRSRGLTGGPAMSSGRRSRGSSSRLPRLFVDIERVQACDARFSALALCLDSD